MRGARDGVTTGILGEGGHAVAAVAHVDACVLVAQVQLRANAARCDCRNRILAHAAHYDGVFAVRLGVACGHVVAWQARGGHILAPPAGALHRRARQRPGALWTRGVAALHDPRVINALLAFLHTERERKPKRASPATAHLLRRRRIA